MTQTVMQYAKLDVHYLLLAEQGFMVLPRHDLQREPPEQDLSGLYALIGHSLNALDDVCGGLRFAEFEDEMVPFRRGDHVYDLFAVAATNACLLTARADGAVHWLSECPPERHGSTFETVKATLSAFVRCICMERAICHRMRARFIGLTVADRTSGAAVSAQRGRELQDFIAAVDAAAPGS